MAFKMKYNKNNFPFKSPMKDDDANNNGDNNENNENNNQNNDKDKKSDKGTFSFHDPNIKKDSFASATGKFLGNMLLGGAENAGLIGKTRRFKFNFGNKDKVQEIIDAETPSNKADNSVDLDIDDVVNQNVESK
jgi:hypothetical protein|tara:strand:+ start:488 stop:889 length:402 start_codon:yes stop_codon:yes gene_type:complete